MNTHGASKENRPHTNAATGRMPRFIETHRPERVHDLLVMSHGPGTKPDERGNHACLNSFASNSWIIAEGGRPNTIAGR